ncbi:hypothetical protein BDN72DRAFT_141377, partial [Pluteus cervinus]
PAQQQHPSSGTSAPHVIVPSPPAATWSVTHTPIPVNGTTSVPSPGAKYVVPIRTTGQGLPLNLPQRALSLLQPLNPLASTTITRSRSISPPLPQATLPARRHLNPRTHPSTTTLSPCRLKPFCSRRNLPR